MTNPVNTQDWETVVFRKRLDKKTEIKSAQRDGNIESIRKIESSNSNTNKTNNTYRLEKLEMNDEKMTLKMIDNNLVNIIKRQRGVKGYTQKELANKAQIPEAQIKNLEQGKEQYNASLLSKLQRVLDIKLLGQNIGQPLK